MGPGPKDNNPKKQQERAIALKYHDANKLPSILAKGYGAIADEIIAMAEANGIPVEKNENLATMLSKIETDHSIPEETFKLVAEVLCFLYHTDKEWREQHKHLEKILGNPEEDDE